MSRAEITAEDRALAEQFAGSLEPQPASRSVDELTEEDLLAIDLAYAKGKDDGSLQRACDHRAMVREMNDGLRSRENAWPR